MPGIRHAIQRATHKGLQAAVHRHRSLSRRGLQERLFTLAFRQLVYPQIWEDPRVDMAALRLSPTDRLIGIASGGCNLLSYLAADPAEVIGVDLNGAHIALNALKAAALRHLPDHATFFRFFGRASSRDNVAVYFERLRPHLDDATRAYWDGRGLDGRRRIEAFARNFYRHGLLGRFIGASHIVAKLYGKNLDSVLAAGSLAEQRVAYEREIAPLFDKRFVRWLARRPSALYGLGIPPAQYQALAQDGAEGIAAVLEGKRVVLVEGPTDKTCIPLLAKRLGVFRYDYTLIDCGSKDNIPLYAQLLNKFKIPYVAVYDLDHQTHKAPDAVQSADKSTALVEASLDRRLAMSVVFDNDIEEELGMQAGQKNKPYAALVHIESEAFTLSPALESKVRTIYASEG